MVAHFPVIHSSINMQICAQIAYKSSSYSNMVKWTAGGLSVFINPSLYSTNVYNLKPRPGEARLFLQTTKRNSARPMCGRGGPSDGGHRAFLWQKVTDDLRIHSFRDAARTPWQIVFHLFFGKWEGVDERMRLGLIIVFSRVICGPNLAQMIVNPHTKQHLSILAGLCTDACWRALAWACCYI